MQEFLMDYGLWLLVALLIVILLVFLLSGRRTADSADVPIAPLAPAEPTTAAPLIATEPVAVGTSPVEVAAQAIAAHAPPPSQPLPVAEPEPVSAPVPTAPVTPSAPAAPSTTSGDADDLLKLKGVGPKLHALLIELGVTRYAQIAAWQESDIAAIDARLGNFRGRPVRDHWVDQAKYLAAGDIAGFEAKYGKL